MRSLRASAAISVLALWTGSTHAQGTAPSQAINDTITAVAGISVGHHTLTERPTGCTVVLVEGQAIGGIAQRGGSPGTRETDLLNPMNRVDAVNAVVLAGGSAFGLDAASGVVRWLEEHGVGFPTSVGPVPIVPAAILFDLALGKPEVRPTADCGYRAAQGASSRAVAQGSVGAGAGATVGKLQVQTRGRKEDRLLPTKSGIGSAAISLPNGLVVGALVAVNAVGDVIDPRTGRLIAGARHADGTFADLRVLLQKAEAAAAPRPGENTTIGVVATNARLTKVEINRIALMADAGYARAIYPSHTESDGDTLFALATGRWSGSVDVSIIGALAAEATALAIVRAASEATGAAGIPSAREIAARK
jgi:L-aminopeptidase/D-esterase-like protein